MSIDAAYEAYLSEEALKELVALQTENVRLTDCVEETIDELLCGNRLYAELTDRQNDVAVLLDSANQTINQLRGELAEAKRELIRTDRILQLEQLAHIETNKELQASEAARQEAVRELDEQKQITRNVADGYHKLQSRLAQAEEALRAINIIWDTETRWVSFDSPDGIHALINIGPAKGRIADKAVAGWHEHYRQAALQPGEKGEKP